MYAPRDSNNNNGYQQV